MRKLNKVLKKPATAKNRFSRLLGVQAIAWTVWTQVGRIAEAANPGRALVCSGGTWGRFHTQGD